MRLDFYACSTTHSLRYAGLVVQWVSAKYLCRSNTRQKGARGAGGRRARDALRSYAAERRL